MKSEGYALITGASKGIGKAMAETLAARGHNLLLVARSASLMAQLRDELEARYGGIKVEIFAADLTDQNVPAELFKWCQAQGLPINILINNAGLGVWETFAEADLAALEQMNAVNVSAVLRMCHVFLPELQAQPRAWLMNVGSTGAFQPLPRMAIYGAGKAYIRSFTRALRDELRETNVSVTCLNPGGVWTGFMETAQMGLVSQRQKRFMMPADKCANIALKAMFKRRAEVIPGWYNRVGVWLVKHIPTSLGVVVARKIFRKS
ncbi:MAG TPA: SDR family oxidoreductase [Bacteroidetes bacterium]|nr:SDR family oxidoreductase [Bacteroidota bacterium]